MQGLAWSGLPSPDGRWLLTLFLSGTGDEAAIHTLDLVSSSAVCIDLPSHGEFQVLQQYGLVLAPDRSRVFAVNPALGVVAVVDLASKKVVRTTSFPHAALPRYPYFTIAAASRDGRTVYFGSGRGVWAYDAAYGKVRGPYRIGGTVAGLGFSPDGRRLWVVRGDGRVSALDAARGTPLRR
jgi:outer membrane protein assembly factor BamB